MAVNRVRSGATAAMVMAAFVLGGCRAHTEAQRPGAPLDPGSAPVGSQAAAQATAPWAPRCTGLEACRAACAEDRAPDCARLGALLAEAGPTAAEERRAALTRACDGKDPEGCYRLGLEADVAPARATELFAFACDRGSAGGCSELGYSLEHGRGGRGVDVPRARELYQRGCDGGHATGCGNLGLMQLLGQGGPKDVAAAARSFAQGCAGGLAAACTSLGRRLEKGEGLARDPAAALEAFRRGCDGDDGDGCNEVGVRSIEGRGVPADAAHGTAMYDKACRLGSAVGCLNLARGWMIGRKGEINEANAIELFVRSCDLGEEDACVELPRSVIGLEEKCSTRGPDMAADCSNLGWIHERGLGVKVDHQRAVVLYERACGAGSPTGCFNLGLQQGEGRGTRRDEKAAAKSLVKACKGGHAVACARVADAGSAD